MSFDQLVLGTAGIGGIWGAVVREDSIQTILQALEAGVTAIDTAPAYRDAEEMVGSALRQWTGPRPFISSKVGRLPGKTAEDAHYDYSRSAMWRSVENTLHKLQVDSLDLLFLHDPEGMSELEFAAAVAVMQELQQQKYTHALGIGGNPPPFAWKWLQQGIFSTLMEFNRLNAIQTPALHTSLPACVRADIHYYAASPLYMGLLGKSLENFSTTPPAWLPAAAISKARQLALLAEEAGITLPTLAHRFLQTIPVKYKVVIGSSNPVELAATLQSFGEGPLPPHLYEKILQISQEYQ
ncbi:aldo/keto reductase [Chitinophaga eiseniae]|uniref:Aldo/keto reductase n=1 Tax=Chitinophaga eiseniae TaxID=634771 RepID=A0A847SUT1_9BACT|nr:aldo/keto reductase [Chitinophaga eiseniae]NLR80362.1 aldo/keto reductase [Chitinophaga eiseniae]